MAEPDDTIHRVNSNEPMSIDDLYAARATLDRWSSARREDVRDARRKVGALLSAEPPPPEARHGPDPDRPPVPPRPAPPAAAPRASQPVCPNTDAHYLTDVNRGSIRMQTWESKLNHMYRRGYRLAHVFEQDGNTVQVYEHHHGH